MSMLRYLHVLFVILFYRVRQIGIILIIRDPELVHDHEWMDVCSSRYKVW